MNYAINIYVTGHGGYFQYKVESGTSAIEHGEQIMRAGVYRHAIKGAVEFWPVYKVKVVGEGLETQYPDEFIRT